MMPASHTPPTVRLTDTLLKVNWVPVYYMFYTKTVEVDVCEDKSRMSAMSLALVKNTFFSNHKSCYLK